MGRRTLHMLGLAGMCLCAVVMTIALSLLVSIFFSNNLFQVQFFLTGNSPKSLPLLIFLPFFFYLNWVHFIPCAVLPLSIYVLFKQCV